MKTKSYIITILMAAMTVLSACDNEELQPTDVRTGDRQPIDKPTWTLVVEASKLAGTKALSLDGEYLNATWSTSESVTVVKVNNYGGEEVGTLHPLVNGITSKLEGELSGTYQVGDKLALLFPKPVVDYSGQKGTLADIAANFDFATDTVSVLSVDESDMVITTDVAIFKNHQSITRFTFNQPVKSLTIGAAGLVGSPLTITPDEPATELFVAMSNRYDTQQLYNFTAEVAGEAWVATKRATLEDGSYYDANVVLEKYDPLTTPICFEATEGGYFQISGTGSKAIEYSKDRETWTIVDYAGQTSIEMEPGECLYLRGDHEGYGSSSSSLTLHFSTYKAKGYIYGNVMSLIQSEGFESLKEITADYAFRGVFESCPVTDHPLKSMVLPATTLSVGCYSSLFSGTNLSRVPELPATELREKCYQQMFQGCRQLVDIPDLRGEKLVDYCYQRMFMECTSLVKAPAILATSMADYVNGCCESMFNGCSQLTDIPDLPVLSLTNGGLDGCYRSMFSNCTSLVSAPALPSTDLASNCYYGMFSYCTSLKNAPTLPATELDPDHDSACYRAMFMGCTSLEIAPDLPAQYATNSCYMEMFENCTALRQVPVISATSMGYQSCFRMFQGCTSLVQAPDLPALYIDCPYGSMFSGCTSLISAPDLPATVLTSSCYEYMFAGCTSLLHAPQTLPATTLEPYCYQGMFKDCTSLVDAPALPATELRQYRKHPSTYGGENWSYDYFSNCYREMFSGCTSLVNAPELPATVLAHNCYEKMFYGCTSLRNAPDLPAEDISSFSACYKQMFQGCISLTQAPVISATKTGYQSSMSMFEGCTSLVDVPAIAATELVAECYKTMFKGCTSLVNAPSLPALTMASHCYDSMFEGCTGLVDAPALPATELADYCYYSIFKDCANLVNAPALPATAMASSCYSDMFSGCASLEIAPALASTSLAYCCYSNMFSGCSSLKSAPALPATTLAGSCYYGMFKDCVNLEIAPDLLAESLESYCYGSMFWNCAKLDRIKCLAKTLNYGTDYYWLYGVASTGTFIKHPEMEDWPSGTDGIPTGWTVANAEL